MVSAHFQRTDWRHFATVVSAFNSHSELTRMEFNYGAPDTSQTGKNKDDRATALVRYLFEKSSTTDDHILALLDDMFVFASSADWRMESDEFRRLEDKVLLPRGVVLTDDGYKYDAVAVRRVDAAPIISSTGATPDSFETRPTLPKTVTTSPPEPAMSRNPKSVFVVHGQDMRPVTVLRTFLLFAGLSMMSWSEAVKATGKTQPTTYEIVKAGIDSAGAIIVIFSPDDEARLKAEFAGGVIQRAEGQPRQNVTLEAGMAYATAPEKTIFVQSEKTRPISDIAGFNWVKMDGTWESREDLVNRLNTAGATTTLHNTNLQDSLAGPFRVS